MKPGPIVVAGYAMILAALVAEALRRFAPTPLDRPGDPPSWVD